ncbi:MAG: ABC transporter substrate-binding protein [Methanomicrobiales archaeon]|nr:ABC transporter substrate-binding protein [Methanomicrobiales archaeon]
MNKRIMGFLAVMSVLILALYPVQGALTITDDVGYSTTIESPPQRIVSLAPANTEILFALGLNDRVVGVTEYCNYPPEAQEKPKVGGYSTVSIEKVIALKPDLILAAYGNGEALISNLRNLGFRVIVLHPETLDGILEDIRLAGMATGAEQNATSLIGEMEERIRRVEERASKARERPRVAHVIWNDPIYVSGNGTFQDELIARAGGMNAFPRVEGWKAVGIEDFLAADPQVLIVNRGTGMGGGEDEIARYFFTEPRFSNVTAIREGRVHLVDTDIVDRAGPRIVDALEQFADAIHPVERTDRTGALTTGGAASTPGFTAGITAPACMFAILLLCIGTRRR